MNFFIGGSPCSGKSTVCEVLAERHGSHAYHCDDHYEAHLSRAPSDSSLTQFQQLSWLDAFTTRSLERMIADELSANDELAAFALEDVNAIGSPVIAEGMPFMPDVMARLQPRASAVYLVPSPAFQRDHYAKREWAQGLLATTADPTGVFERWMARDEASARFIRARATALGFAVLEVDGQMSIEETVIRIPLNHFIYSWE